MDYDICIVGAGLSGATLAEHAARDGYKVLVLEKRDHIAGNCYDRVDADTGIRISQYGAHLFHTNDLEVWNYVQHFGPWKPWVHKVVAKCQDTLVPIPVNPTTVNLLFGESITTEFEMKQWLRSECPSIPEIRNSEDVALTRVGPRLYKLLFEPYTKKQWAKSPAELEPSVLERIPIRTTFDERYFSDRFQGLPVHGYTAIVEQMLNHPNITVKLNTDWETIKGSPCWKTLVFTGPIDQYFQSSGLPKLEYRSIKFHWATFENSGYFQPNSVVNYSSENIPMTRAVEYKHFLNQKSSKTIVSFETTCDDGEPYYPVPTERNRKVYEEYKRLAEQQSDVHFVGRLASYKYFNMDQAIRNAMDYYAGTLKKSLSQVQ